MMGDRDFRSIVENAINSIGKELEIEIEDKKELYGYQQGDIDAIFERLESAPKNHHLLGDLVEIKKVKRMISISEGWYIISQDNGNLYFNDLRFGLLSLEPKSENFVFKYKIEVDNLGEITFTEAPKDKRDGKKLLSDLWVRLKGN